jgi:hypothetical protein
MATLFAITYPDPQRAAQAMASVERADAEHLIRLQAACWIGKENGELAVHPRERSGTGAAAAGGGLGLLVGALFSIPVVGLAAGAAVGDRLAAGGSAVVVLFEEGADTATAGVALVQFGGTVHSTDLPAERLARFQAALDGGGGRIPRLTGEATDAEGRAVRRYEVVRFGAFQVGGPADVVYEPGEACAFAVSAAAADHAHIKIHMVGDVVHIDWDAGLLGRRAPAVPLVYRFVAPRVDEIRIGERISARVDELAVDRLHLVIGKDSTVTMSGLRTRSLKAQLAAGARATVAGTADRHAVTVGEAGNYDASGLVAREVKAEARQGAVVVVRVEKALEARADGDGRVTYVGNPSKLKTDARNGGTVIQGE